ncbi:MAG: transposase [Deltaproteobacteria bacterium]|nr:transposase [Deltaproteobacteria bacterium]
MSKVYLPSCQDLKLDQMYEAMDMLQAHSSAVAEAVFFRTAHLFNLEVDLIFYDTTTAAFAIDEEDDDQGLRRFGRSKNGAWSPQVVIALAVTRDGLPVRSWVFPGQTADASTVTQIKADLRGWNLGRALFVADAGMNSEQNRQELAKACATYLLATRLGSQAEVKAEVLTRPGRFKVIAENLQAKEVIVGDGERRRRYIVCYNPLEAKRQQLHREQVLRELEAELAKHPDLKATARWAIDLLASGRYRRYVKIEAATNRLAINRQAAREAARTDGKWLLITNDDTITLEDAASGYKGLLVIERCFRTLKSTQIKLTPMYHWLPPRIEAHIKICVLALLLARVAERQCQLPWKRIRDDLDTLQVTEFQTPNFRFFQRHEPTENLLSTLKSLEISMPKPVLSITPTTTNA